MFQQISKLPNRRVFFAGHLKLFSVHRSTGLPFSAACLTDLLKINEDVQRTTFRFAQSQIRSDGETARQAISSTDAFGELIESVNKCDDVQVLLDTILPVLSDSQSGLNIEQLAAICDRLNYLQGALSPKNYQASSLKESYELTDRYGAALRVYHKATNSSPSISQLLDRAGPLINAETDKKQLITLFQSLSRLRKNPASSIVKTITLELAKKMDSLNLAELANCLTSMSHYFNNPAAIDHLFAFKLRLLQLARRKILFGEDLLNDLNLTIQYLLIFLKSESRTDFQMTEYLTDRLLSPSLHLTAEHYVNIFQKIAQSGILIYMEFSRHKFNVQARRRTNQINAGWQPKQTLGECLVALINRCNEEICKGLSVAPTDEQFNLLLIQYLQPYKHEGMQELFQFSKSYSDKFIRLINSKLRQHFDPTIHGRLFGDLSACGKLLFNAQDDSLVKLYYERFCADEELRRQVNIYRFYMVLTKNRHSFVDHQLLASKLMSSSEQFRRSVEKRELNCVHMLARLVLNDVHNEELYDLLGELAARLNGDSFRHLSSLQYFDIALANAYLLTPFCRLDDNLREKVQDILGKLLNSICLASRKPAIRYRHRHRFVQYNGYLSNGIFLKHFAIFDRSINDLVPLDQYASHFNSVDSIPLTDQQQL